MPTRSIVELSLKSRHFRETLQTVVKARLFRDSLREIMRDNHIATCSELLVFVTSLLSPSGNGRKALAFRRRLQ
jgi:hypothetical protein